MKHVMARYPTQEYSTKIDRRNRCAWFYRNHMMLIADRNNQTIKIRKMRNNPLGQYVEITS